MFNRFLYGILLLAMLSLAAPTKAHAQQFVLRTSVFSAGGHQSTGGNLILQSTVGQPGVGQTTGSNLLLDGGFWPQTKDAAGPLAVPTATDDAVTIAEDGSAEINVLANDTDPGGGALSIIDIGTPDHGQVAASGAATLIYTPDANFFGEDRFNYVIQNEHGGQAEATVTITVVPVNDTPVFTSSPLVEVSADMEYRYLATATDVEGDARTFTAPVLPSWLALVEQTDSTAALVGTPTVAEAGEHSVTLEVSDGEFSSRQTFTVTVTASSLAAPALVAPVDEAVGQPLDVRLRWNPVAGATSYEVRIDTDSTFQLPFVADIGTVGQEVGVPGLVPNTTYYWRVRALDGSGPGPYSAAFRFTTAVSVATEDEAGVPTVFALHQNYPNPFNPTTTIAYDLTQPAEVRLVVYDLFGRAVETLVEAQQAAGRYTVPFDAEGLASGTYFYRVEAGAWSQTKQFILLK